MGARQRIHQPGADVIRPPAGRKTAHARQAFLVRRRVGGDVGQGLILHDAAAGQVLLPRFDLAPCGKRLEPPEHFGLAAGDSHPFPGLGRIIGVIAGIGEALHLLVEPGAAAGLLQPVQHLWEERRKIGDVADRIVDLAFVERPARPIREARALIEALAEHVLDEVRITDLLAEPERHGRDLRIEQRMRGAARQVEDDFEILAARMKDLQYVLVVDQQVEERREIQTICLGIDGRGFFRIGDLHQAQVRPIGILAHEFGVDCDEVGLGEALAQLQQRVAVGDQRMDMHARSP